MTSISDLPDDSLYLADPDQVREFVSGVCIADSIVEVIIGSGEATCRAALLTVDFSTDPTALEALERLPEPSLSGTVRWSWLHGRGTDAEDEGDGTLWRFDVTTDTDDPVSFAVAGVSRLRFGPFSRRSTASSSRARDPSTGWASWTPSSPRFQVASTTR